VEKRKLIPSIESDRDLIRGRALPPGIADLKAGPPFSSGKAPTHQVGDGQVLLEKSAPFRTVGDPLAAAVVKVTAVRTRQIVEVWGAQRRGEGHRQLARADLVLQTDPSVGETVVFLQIRLRTL
jgi:hypothetical protein